MITEILGRTVPADTIGGLLDWRVAASPDLAFARCGDDAVTYRQLDALARRIEAGLHAAGVAAGAHVAVIAANSITHLAIMFACARTGACWAPVNISLGTDDMAYTLDDLAPALVFAEAEHLAVIPSGLTAAVVVLDGRTATKDDRRSRRGSPQPRRRLPRRAPGAPATRSA